MIGRHCLGSVVVAESNRQVNELTVLRKSVIQFRQVKKNCHGCMWQLRETQGTEGRSQRKDCIFYIQSFSELSEEMNHRVQENQ